MVASYFSRKSAEFTSEPVLVVDDDLSNRLIMKSILEKKGFKVDECNDGFTCIEYCKHKKPALVLLDWMMTGLDGPATCRQLRKIYSREKVPVIMVTAKNTSADVAVGLDAGANDYITKPVDHTVLLARIGLQLELSRTYGEVNRQREELNQNFRILNAMGAALPEAVIIHDTKGKLIYCNELVKSLCNWEEPKNLEDVHSKIFSGALALAHSSILEKIRKDPHILVDEEVEAKLAKSKYVEIFSEPLPMGLTSELRLWLWRDVTKIRELERSSAQKSKLETMAVFANGVAHNFNNLLGGILGATELLAKQNRENQRALNLIKMIEDGSRRASKISKRMLALNNQNVIELEDKGPTKGTLRDVVAKVFAINKDIYGDRVTQIIDLAEENIDLGISPSSVFEILNNLISNAYDSIKDKGEVRVTFVSSTELKKAEIVISDTGKGMDNETLAKLYEPFFSTKNLDDKNGVSMVGNGLGLWSVYNILKTCGGDIQFESEPGKGTDVIVHLPLK